MSKTLYRFTKNSFENGSKIVAVVYEDQVDCIQGLAYRLANLHDHEINVEMKIGEKWSTDDLIGDFGIAVPKRLRRIRGGR